MYATMNPYEPALQNFSATPQQLYSMQSLSYPTFSGPVPVQNSSHMDWNLLLASALTSNPNMFNLNSFHSAAQTNPINYAVAPTRVNLNQSYQQPRNYRPNYVQDSREKSFLQQKQKRQTSYQANQDRKRSSTISNKRQSPDRKPNTEERKTTQQKTSYRASPERKPSPPREPHKPLLVVVDTNVLIEHLEDILNFKYHDFITVIIPLIVIQELDGLKKDEG
eukprot:TRINITY_DN17814_c0_g1_i1.p1 TRINITY_DN17814_c0_g1~~TRINITY_DN17814_c0_g1_i1.p1  ORF type:complete len:222 (-),score=39.19 TRINITY_DN17814_c0_g1_i1:426-1091(-)